MDCPKWTLCDCWPLCVIENIFWKNSALYNPPWNNLSIYLLWVQFSRTNINVLQMKSCIWQSTHHCQLEQSLLLVNSTHIKSRPMASYLLNMDYVCEHSRCGNAATSRSTMQAGKNLGDLIVARLLPEIQKPFVHLYTTHELWKFHLQCQSRSFDLFLCTFLLNRHITHQEAISSGCLFV